MVGQDHFDAAHTSWRRTVLHESFSGSPQHIAAQVESFRGSEEEAKLVEEFHSEATPALTLTSTLTLSLIGGGRVLRARWDPLRGGH